MSSWPTERTCAASVRRVLTVATPRHEIWVHAQDWQTIDPAGVALHPARAVGQRGGFGAYPHLLLELVHDVGHGLVVLLRSRRHRGLRRLLGGLLFRGLLVRAGGLFGCGLFGCDLRVCGSAGDLQRRRRVNHAEESSQPIGRQLARSQDLLTLNAEVPALDIRYGRAGAAQQFHQQRLDQIAQGRGIGTKFDFALHGRFVPDVHSERQTLRARQHAAQSLQVHLFVGQALRRVGPQPPLDLGHAREILKVNRQHDLGPLIHCAGGQREVGRGECAGEGLLLPHPTGGKLTIGRRYDPQDFRVELHKIRIDGRPGRGLLRQPVEIPALGLCDRFDGWRLAKLQYGDLPD